MLEVENLSKTIGSKRVVDSISFEVRPGEIIGLLGPNGAGKTTTIRMILGLSSVDSGAALIDGETYASLSAPIRKVGASLEFTTLPSGFNARRYLKRMAITHGIKSSRVEEVLSWSGLTAAGNKAIGTYSLGMRQRLKMAAALLGDPRLLVLDEPLNGLDPEGISWMRGFLSYFVSSGRGVLISSHSVSEIADLADRLIIMGLGKVVAHDSVQSILDKHGVVAARVQTTRSSDLAAALRSSQVYYHFLSADTLSIFAGIDQVRRIAERFNVPLSAGVEVPGSLEDVYFRLTNAASEYSSSHELGTL
ncbi:MAG: ATP-binding cassette domain-containing protein [Microbacterium sp.]|uniref:ABC transporter ATP-binding protein n=1 Tax=Microbacterium sp. TaxID=51671 RepID=UPI0039E41420